MKSWCVFARPIKPNPYWHTKNKFNVNERRVRNLISLFKTERNEKDKENLKENKNRVKKNSFYRSQDIQTDKLAFIVFSIVKCVIHKSFILFLFFRQQEMLKFQKFIILFFFTFIFVRVVYVCVSFSRFLLETIVLEWLTLHFQITGKNQFTDRHSKKKSHV